MYIEYKSIKYPCLAAVGVEMVYSGLPSDFPFPAVEEITLCADDGFVIKVDDPNGYLRQTFEEGVLRLSNVPEVEPVEPVTPVIDESDTAVLNALLGVSG